MRAARRALAAAAAALLAVRLASASLDRLRKFQRECFPVTPCVMVLDRRGAYGCGQCTEDSVDEQVSELLQAEQLRNFLNAGVDRRFLLIPELLFFQYRSLQLLSFSDAVAGVVVYDGFFRDEDPGDEDSGQATTPEAFSADRIVPNQPHSLDPFEYNAVNQSVVPQFQFYPFNIFRVNATVAARIRDRAKKFARDPRDADADPASAAAAADSVSGTVTTTSSSLHPTYVLQSNGRMFACPKDAKEQQQSQDNATADPGGFKVLNSTQCLRDRTCLPIGGQSVWSSLGILLPDPDQNRKVLAVTAPMDSTAIFHAAAEGAAAEIASLATMMAVVEAVADYHRATGKDREMLMQPVYFAWDAQSWGFSGSSRFLKDVRDFECETKPETDVGCSFPYKRSLRFKDFDGAEWSVLNLAGLVDPKQSGDDRDTNSTEISFFMHGHRNVENNTVRDALLNSSPNISIVDSSPRLVPPDASQSFVQILGEDLDIVSLANYADEFSNKLFHSQFDNATLLPATRRESLVRAAGIAARAIIRLVYADESPDITVKMETIDSFVDCFTSNWTSTDCELSRLYNGEEEYEERKDAVTQSNYAGIFAPQPEHRQMAPGRFAKIDLVRTFMAYHNRFDEGDACKKDQDCSKFATDLNEDVENESQRRFAHCARGKCVASDTFFHDSYGTGIEATSGFGSTGSPDLDAPQFEVSEEANADSSDGSPEPPQYTESYWDPDLGLCGLTKDSQGFGFAILFGGMGLTLVSAIAAWLLRWSLLPRKQDDEEHEDEAEVPLTV